MIVHHAQAIRMSVLAPDRGASASIRTLCERIINAQTDEIAIMQQWLRDRGLPVPDPWKGAAHAAHGAPGHDLVMPGMLSDAQLRELEGASGSEFDRLFLTYMIQHHQGAVDMVKQLHLADGAGQDEAVFKLAADINADQTTEIARMRRMLIALRIEQRLR
jgi:uncharacterized protein (DUF305 family)